MKTLLVFPLRLELTLVLEHLVRQGCVPQEISVGREKATLIESHGLVLAPGGHGKTQFALHTQYFLHHLSDVGRVFCVGCSGALQEGLKLGSVIVASETIEHDFQLKFISKPLPKFPGDADLLAQMKSTVEKYDLKNVHFGRIASGDEDVVDRMRAFEIYNDTKALAVAWEGAGGARAAAFHRMPYLEIRGISDNADESSVQSFADGLKQAMEPVADLILKWSRASQNGTSNF